VTTRPLTLSVIFQARLIGSKPTRRCRHTCSSSFDEVYPCNRIDLFDQGRLAPTR